VIVKLPLVLNEAAVIDLLQKPVSRDPVVQRVGGAHVAYDLNAGRTVVQQIVQAGERVCGSAQPVRVQAHGADFAAELKVVAA